MCCFSNSKVHAANLGPIWGRQIPGGPHVGLIIFAIWVASKQIPGAVLLIILTSIDFKALVSDDIYIKLLGVIVYPCNEFRQK